MSEWISVKDELPPLSTSVLCWVKNHCQFISVVLSRELTTHDGLYSWVATFAFKHNIEGMEGYKEPIFPSVDQSMITHWMPLPEPPK